VNEIALGLKSQREDLHKTSVKVQFSTYYATALHAKKQRQMTRMRDDRCLCKGGRDRSTRRKEK